VPVELLGKCRRSCGRFLRRWASRLSRGPNVSRALRRASFDFAAMTNVPGALRARLAEEARITLPRIVRRFPSVDGPSGICSRLAARMRGPRRSSPSSCPRKAAKPFAFRPRQAARVDCHFCLTAQLGLIRNLTAGEIIGQVLVALPENREQLTPQTNVVLMGQGEPMLNYDSDDGCLPDIAPIPNGVAACAQARHVVDQRHRSGDRAARARRNPANLAIC